MTSPTESPPWAPGTQHRRADLVPGLLVAVVGVAGALVAHRVLDQIGVLTWAVALGAAAANLGLLPERVQPGLRVATKRLLRVGVVLVGLSLSLVSIAALGVSVIVLIVVTLFTTLITTTWLGIRMGLGRPRSLLIGTGFAICGASAIAAVEETAEADDDDVAMAIAMVTLCGTAAMVALPLLQEPLGLTDVQLGSWAGAAVHEVGQVVGAASPAGAAAIAVAMVVKLTRVLLLAPVVAGLALLRRRRAQAEGGGNPSSAKLPPPVPLFVLGFLACVAVRTADLIPAAALPAVGHLQTVTLGAALFGMGTGVHLRSLLRNGAPALLLSATSTVVIAGVSLVGVLLLVSG